MAYNSKSTVMNNHDDDRDNKQYKRTHTCTWLIVLNRNSYVKGKEVKARLKVEFS